MGSNSSIGRCELRAGLSDPSNNLNMGRGDDGDAGRIEADRPAYHQRNAENGYRAKVRELRS